jgi:serine/threonine protein kinase/CheY-like chemotaxis protein
MTTETSILGGARILAVDDDELVRRVLERFLTGLGCEVALAEDGMAAASRLEEEEFDAVITDINMPRMDGLSLLREIRQTRPELPVILVTGQPVLEAAVDCMRQGAFDYIAKPFDLHKLKARLAKAVQQHREMAAQVAAGDRPMANLNYRRYFQHYRIRRILGEGGTGIVFLAERPAADPTATPALFALKVMKTGSSPTAAHQPQRFMHEACAAMKVRHPHVVAIVEFGLTPDELVPFIVMEYVEGVTLKQWAEQFRGLDHRRKAELVRQVAGALAAIHAHGITHRDVKPHNIMVTGDFQTRLMDFGIARLPDSELTVGGELLGSPAYLAPEAFETSQVGPAADLFSLGIVLYELCLGRKPFEADSIARYAHVVRHGQPIMPRLLDQDFPLELETILSRLLQKEPADRYPSAAALEEDLAAFVAGQPLIHAVMGDPEVWERA